jgi:hypothetical protein
MTFDPWGSATASWREKCERISAEVLRRVKLLAQNDPTVVPPANDASAIIAGRHFILPPPQPAPDPSSASAILAARAFAAIRNLGTAARTLTFGTHLTGSSYDGSLDVTLGTDATDANTASTIVARDANGDFTARRITAAQFRGAHYMISTGAAPLAGQADLVAGTKTVNTTVISGASLVFLTRITPTGALGHLSWTIVAGTSFTINSSSATDTSTVGWAIIERY